LEDGKIEILEDGNIEILEDGNIEILYRSVTFGSIF
jgi:hypothetical protein